MQIKQKRRFGDRKDAYRIRDLDAMHAFAPYIIPDRVANEAVCIEHIDVTEMETYLKKKNAANPQYKYTMFHVICAALAKTLYMRPKMNTFIAGHRYYQRKDISFSFVAKKELKDHSYEALAIIKLDQEDKTSPIEQLHDKICNFVHGVRNENKTDVTTNDIAFLNKFPRPILRFIIRILNWLDYHGKIPSSLSKADPYYSSIFISNLGSVKMSASYHHLSNYGTNSIFIIIGEKKKRPVFNEDGSYEMKDTLELGLTIDERIADGIYFSNSIKLLKKLVQNPELLDLPIGAEVE